MQPKRTQLLDTTNFRPSLRPYPPLWTKDASAGGSNPLMGASATNFRQDPELTYCKSRPRYVWCRRRGPTEQPGRPRLKTRMHAGSDLFSYAGLWQLVYCKFYTQLKRRAGHVWTGAGRGVAKRRGRGVHFSGSAFGDCASSCL